MAPSRTRTLALVTTAVLGVLALRPVPAAERALDLALVPCRWLAALALPVGALQGREAHAAGERRKGAFEEELALHRRLEASVLDSAWPLSFELADGVGAVQAEVIGRPSADLDRIRLRVAEPERVRPGQPVVSGDGYVGLVVRVPSNDPAPKPRGLLARLLARIGIAAERDALPPDVVEVELITDSDARVGGLVIENRGQLRSRMVVGGLAVRRDATWLAVHNPESRGTRAGIVRVHEPIALRESLAHLAEGFELGTLRLEEVELPGEPVPRQVLGIRPTLDFDGGLYQVLVLTADGIAQKGRAAPGIRTNVLQDGGWLPVSFLLRAEPSPWRSGCKLDQGRRQGVARGAAVRSGARFVGRVQRAGLTASDVALLADRGLEWSALAEPLEGVDRRPIVLGRLVSLGPGPRGLVRVHWRGDPGAAVDSEPSAAADSDAPDSTSAGLRVRLWTGSGEAGVPRGLLVGETRLPPGPGPHVLLVEQPDEARHPKALRVRVQKRAEALE